MRLFADHCVPTDVVVALRTLGCQVERAYDVGLDRASDAEIFAYARQHRRILLTTDRDFGNIVRFAISTSPGVVILELEEVSRTTLVKRVQGFFRAVRPSSLRGRLTLLEPTRIRIWPKS